jgi:hypothetical protein
MPDPVTTNKGIDLPPSGSYVNAWATPVNNNWTLIDTCLGGHSQITVTGVGAGTIALTLSQYQTPIIEFFGTLSAALNYQLPTGVGGTWVIVNGTTATGGGSLTFSIAGAGLSPVSIPQGGQTFVFSDGANVFLADNATAAAAESAAIAAAASSAASLYVAKTTTVGLMTGVTIQADPGGTPSGSPGDLFLFY